MLKRVKSDSAVWGFTFLIFGSAAAVVGTFLFFDNPWILHAVTVPGILLTVFGVLGVSFPSQELKSAMNAVPRVYQQTRSELERLIEQVSEVSTTLRKEGLIAAENFVNSVSDPLIKKGLELLARGAQAAKVKEVLELEAAEAMKREENAGRVWVRASSIAQWSGVIIGLLQLSIGGIQSGRMGQALIAPFYGFLFAQFFCVPWSFKLAAIAKQAATRIMMGKVSILSIQEGESPAVLREKLETYLGKK